MVLNRSSELESHNLEGAYLKKRFENKKVYHPVLDFFLPHEFGGLGEPIDNKYKQLNLFNETMDIPAIKPRTLPSSKNEFNVIINREAAGIKVADMNLFSKPVKVEADQEVLKEKKLKLKELKDELHKQEKILRDLQDE